MTLHETNTNRPRLGAPRLLDFALAACLVIATNWISCPSIDDRRHDNPRLLSHLVMDSQIRRLPPERRLSTILLGDSRSIGLSASLLCEALGKASGECFNASSTAGEWVTAHLLFERLRPHLGATPRVLIFVSDYWLVGPDTGLLVETRGYADLGEPMKSLASFVPNSALRRTRVEWLQARLAAAANHWRILLRATTREALAEEQKERLLTRVFRSNVDLWFAPISDAERASRQRLARAAIRSISRGGNEVVLVYLPNLEMRDAYLDEHHPGARQRSMAALADLASELDLPLLDLSDRLRSLSHFKDFHHLNENGRARVLEILAETLPPQSGRGANRAR